MKTKTIGSSYRFTYPNYGTPESHPEYRAHSNQIVTIKRQLLADECDPAAQPSFQIEAADGWTGTAHGSELRALRLTDYINERVTVKATHHPKFGTTGIVTTVNRRTRKLTIFSNNQKLTALPAEVSIVL